MSGSRSKEKSSKGCGRNHKMLRTSLSSWWGSGGGGKGFNTETLNGNQGHKLCQEAFTPCKRSKVQATLTKRHDDGSALARVAKNPPKKPRRPHDDLTTS